MKAAKVEAGEVEVAAAEVVAAEVVAAEVVEVEVAAAEVVRPPSPRRPPGYWSDSSGRFHQRSSRRSRCRRWAPRTWSTRSLFRPATRPARNRSRGCAGRERRGGNAAKGREGDSRPVGRPGRIVVVDRVVRKVGLAASVQVHDENLVRQPELGVWAPREGDLPVQPRKRRLRGPIRRGRQPGDQNGRRGSQEQKTTAHKRLLR
jgi:hypothetical protein